MAHIADIVVIGSGVLGCATAYCLAESEQQRVTVVDRGPLVSGMTRRNAGLVHTFYQSPTCMRLALQSLDTYRHWGGLIGGSNGFAETGTLLLARDEATSQELEERVRRQRDLGVDVRMLDRRELALSFPAASFKDVAAVAYEPISGYLDPVLACQGLARRAREHGTRFETGTLVRSLGQERGRITEVATTTGVIQTPVVIVAAGSGAERLLTPLGYSLDVRSRRGAIGFFDQPAALHAGHPVFVDTATGDLIRPHPFHLTTAGISRELRRGAGDLFEDVVADDEAKQLSSLVALRLPQLEEAPLRRSHAILYDYLADGSPALGAVPGIEGLFVIAGFGDSAVAVAPAAGRALAELVVDGRASMDVRELSPARSGIAH